VFETYGKVCKKRTGKMKERSKKECGGNNEKETKRESIKEKERKKGRKKK
jgi:hypothetical protein